MRRFFLALLLGAFLFGTPYAALILNRAMGPWNATAVERDGSTTAMQFDPDLPPADFVPIFPGARVVQSSRVVAKDAPSGVGFLELAVHASAAEVRDFYRSRLEATGFTVDDYGTMGLNPAAAAYLGVDGTLAGKRPATDDVVVIQIRDEEGILLRTRLLQLQWRKLSEWPAGQPKP
ncbi:MAG: hypothetical protein JO213_02350 [Alphaproteobacteria bacterium]|nr:hypothetical protein [Alphaproteobacteria bacterium]MBV9966883.1 hypothetical protein [Alphaproteobacteria bacterium]